MQRKTASEIKVGLLIALSLVILVLLLTNSANWRRGIGGKILKVRFDFVSNLQLGAPVHMAGVEIGRIIDIKLLEEGVEVTMRIKSPQPIREGCVASIGFLGVVGETYVEIENGPLGNPPLPDKAVIKGKNPVSTATVLSKAEKAAITVIDMAQAALQAVKESRSDLQSNIAELRGKLDKILASLDETLTSLRKTSDELRMLASENREKLAHIASQVDRITRKAVQDYDDVLPQVKSLITQLDEAIAAVKDAARTFESTGRKLDVRVKEMQAQLTDSSSEMKGRVLKEIDSIHQAVEEWRKLSASFKTASDELVGLLEGIRSGEGTIGALLKSDETLRRAHDTMSQIERAAKDTSDALQALRSEVNFTGGLVPRWNAGIRYTTSSSLISQLAFRLGDLKLGITMTGNRPGYDLQYIKPFHIGPSLFEARIGTIRSKAGAGFDWWWLSRKLGLSLDVSDSGSKRPKIDTYLRLRLLKGWCLSLGGEDLAGKMGFSAGLMKEAGGE